MFQYLGDDCIYTDILTDSFECATDSVSEYIVSDSLYVFRSYICTTLEDSENFRGFYECD